MSGVIAAERNTAPSHAAQPQARGMPQIMPMAAEFGAIVSGIDWDHIDAAIRNFVEARLATRSATSR